MTDHLATLDIKVQQVMLEARSPQTKVKTAPVLTPEPAEVDWDPELRASTHCYAWGALTNEEKRKGLKSGKEKTLERAKEMAGATCALPLSSTSRCREQVGAPEGQVSLIFRIYEPSQGASNS